MGLGDAYVQVVPGRDLVQADGAVVVEVRVDAAGSKGVHPAVVVEIFLPGIEESAILKGGLDDLTKAAVALGEDALQHTGGRIVVVDLDLAGMYTAKQIFLLFPQFLASILGAELERGVRLGHEAGHADGDLDALAFRTVGDGIEQVDHLLGGVSDAFDVLHRLGRQAHHEVELD